MIYENICKLAKERGISINKLEEKANVSTGSICKWGNSVSPTVKNIKKVVDLFETKADEGNTCTARKRDWSVIPDTEGDGTDALIYKGSLKAAGEIIKGTATTTDSWQTCTFTAE